MLTKSKPVRIYRIGRLSFNRGMSMRKSTFQWPFAPLQSKSEDSRPKLQGIVFDVDGTLCLPQTYMFQEMRDTLGIPKTVDILDHIHALPLSEQEDAQEKIRAIERRAMRAQTPQPGLVKLMDYLDSRGVQKALCTRNFDEPVNHLLTNFLPGHKFHPIITRAFHPPKPDPAGILKIASTWGVPAVDAKYLIMVGDSHDDMKAGRGAGCTTILVSSSVNGHLREHGHTDVCIEQ